jgi:hypothetical protein
MTADFCRPAVPETLQASFALTQSSVSAHESGNEISTTMPTTNITIRGFSIKTAAISS